MKLHTYVCKIHEHGGFLHRQSHTYVCMLTVKDLAISFLVQVKIFLESCSYESYVYIRMRRLQGLATYIHTYVHICFLA